MSRAQHQILLIELSPATSSSRGKLVACDRCGFDKFIDAVIHNGQSVRRDCARCRTTMGFPIWYGCACELKQPPGRRTPSPIEIRGEIDAPGATVR